MKGHDQLPQRRSPLTSIYGVLRGVFNTHVKGEAYGGADEIEVLLLHRRRQEIEQAIHELRLVIHRDHAVAFIHKEVKQRAAKTRSEKAGPILTAQTVHSHNCQSRY